MLLNFVLHGTRKGNSSEPKLNSIYISNVHSMPSFVCFPFDFNFNWSILFVIKNGSGECQYHLLESEMLIQLFTASSYFVHLRGFIHAKALTDRCSHAATHFYRSLLCSLLKYRENSNQASELHDISFISPFQLKFRVLLKSSAKVWKYYILAHKRQQFSKCLFAISIFPFVTSGDEKCFRSFLYPWEENKANMKRIGSAS